MEKRSLLLGAVLECDMTTAVPTAARTIHDRYSFASGLVALSKGFRLRRGKGAQHGRTGWGGCSLP